MNEARWPSCSASGCSRPALALSNPILCADHVADFDAWYDDVLERFGAVAPISESEKTGSMTLSAMLYGQYRENSVLRGPAVDLYRAFDSQNAGRFGVSAMYAEGIYWLLGAMASGIAGNFAYDVLKNCIDKIRAREPHETASQSLETTVTVEVYERERIKLHASAPLQTPDEFLERTIERKYRLIVHRPVRSINRRTFVEATVRWAPELEENTNRKPGVLDE